MTDVLLLEELPRPFDLPSSDHTGAAQHTRSPRYVDRAVRVIASTTYWSISARTKSHKSPLPQGTTLSAISL